jgi:hypothetical protein
MVPVEKLVPVQTYVTRDVPVLVDKCVKQDVPFDVEKVCATFHRERNCTQNYSAIRRLLFRKSRCQRMSKRCVRLLRPSETFTTTIIIIGSAFRAL